jgi:L-threonylcarbamoyladenylate synthase
VEHAVETQILATDNASIEMAAEVIRRGGLVAIPTETVYGLAADARNGIAVARLFEAKGRPQFNPLIVHVLDVEAARSLAEFDDAADKLAAAFWPGPLTLVLRRREGSGISDLVTAGLSTLAIRIPAHPVARAFLAACGRPLAAPSANRSGHVSPTTARHVAADLSGRINLILDGGPCEVGIESTVVDCSEGRPSILRPGGVSAEAAEEVLQRRLKQAAAGEVGSTDEEAPRSPGQLASHYAPQARLRLNVNVPEPGEALLAFGPQVPPHCGPMINLSEQGDLREAAANLFSALRALDAKGCQSIAVLRIPGEGIGEAINDRLLRAAAPRP